MNQETEPTGQPPQKFAPRWLAWEITGRCNLACIHCRASADLESGKDDCSTEEARRTLADIASYARPVVVLSGGEPLLRPDIFEVAAYGNGLGLRMCLATNGTLITPEVCARLKESGIRMVSLSLDGSSAEVHDNFRNVPGAFEGILRGAALLREHEDQILMRPTCAPHYYRIYRELARAAGVKFERRNLKFSTGGGKGCIAGQLICLIDQRGNVQPCSYLPRVAGNVRRQPFRDIWENSPLFRELRDFSLYRGKCGACEYLKVCGGCRARADAVHGHYLEEEPFCDYIPGKLKRMASGE